MQSKKNSGTLAS